MVRLMLACALTLGAAEPALALDPNSTMAEWSAASAADREALIGALGPRLSPSFRSEKAEIVACIDRAAEAAGHADIPVGEIAKACVEAAEPDRKTTPSTDI